MPARRKTIKSKKPTVISKKTKFLSNYRIKDLILPVAIVAVVLLLGSFKHVFVAATVNGQQISKQSLLAELEKQNGKDVLENLVTEVLITQEAKKKKLDIPANDINTEISKIEKSVSEQGQSLDTLLAQRNMSREDLVKQVKIQLLLRRMVGEQKVEDKEVDDYIEKNKESIPDSTDSASIKAQVKEQLEQQKVSEKIQEFIAELQKKAKIEYLVK